MSIKAFALVTCMLFTVSMVNAQETITWKGENSSDATDVQNWDPPTGMAGNHVVVSHLGNYFDPENPNHPVVTGSDYLEFPSLSVSAPFHYIEYQVDEEGDPVLDGDGNPIIVEEIGPFGAGQITFSMDEGIEAHANNPDNAATHVGGTIIVNSGNFNHRRNFMLDDGASEAVFIVEGSGHALLRDHLGMGNRNGTAGGKVYIRNNGVLNVTTYNKIIRFAPDYSLLTITDNGRLIMNGDSRGEYAGEVESGLITGGDDFFIHYYYESELNQTFYVAKPEGTVLAYFMDRLPERPIFLVVGEEGPEIALEMNNAVAAATNFEWKAGTDPEGPFETVLGSSTETSVLSPQFDAGGTFYVVGEATTPEGTLVSNPLTFVVGSANLVLTPGDAQYIRGDQVGATITATALEGEITAGEWTWSQTAGIGYQSFDPAITGTEITPDFDEVGEYFIRFEAEVDGVADVSSEIRIVKQAWDAGSLNLTWTGVIDEDYHNAANWNPIAQPHRNNIIIPVDVAHWPVFSQGVDTIMGGSSIHYQAPVMEDDVEVEPAIWAKLIIRGGDEDSLKWRGNVNNFAGELLVESGVFVKDQDLLRMHNNTSTITVTGTGVAIFNQWGSNPHPALMMGNATEPTVGGQVHISGDGKIIFHPANIFRISTNPEADFSFFTLSDNGQMLFQGDHTSGVATYINNNRIRLQDNHVHRNLYDHLTDYTYVMARDLDAFAISQTTTQFVAVGTDSDVLTLINADGLSHFTWHLSQGPFGPWEAFDPAVEGAEVTVQFQNIGQYYVVAQAADGSLTANSLLFRVIDFAVASSEDEGVYTLSVELPEGMTGLGWQYKFAEEEEYADFELAGEELEYVMDAFDFVLGDGVYHVTYLGVMQDDTGADVQLFATPVTVTVTDGEIASVVEGSTETGLDLVDTLKVGIYPNPSNGTFYVNAGADTYTVEVIDMSGAVVASQKVSGDGQAITISSKGVFIVKVTSADGVGVSRVVVK